jgi:3D (Asp-Asp-Asp) domain-containing protein
MKKLIKISEEIVPLSRRQQAVLLLIVSCVFQFTLFFTPALAAEAVSQELEANQAPTSEEIVIEVNKESAPDENILIFENEKNTNEATEEQKVIRSSFHTITAYNSEAAQTDDSPCITANGFNVCEHGTEDTIAANFLKFGTKVRIPELFGDRVFVVRDRMNRRHADRVDVWMNNRQDALKFGIRVAKIEVLE